MAIDKTLFNIELPIKFDISTRNYLSDEISVFLNSKKDIACLDFTNVTYIDSSAIGQLLVFNSKAKDKGKTIMLSNAKGKVKEVFDFFNLKRTFIME